MVSIIGRAEVFAPRLAWMLWGLCVALLGSSLLLGLLTPDFLTPVERPRPIFATFSALLSLMGTTIGALVASRLPKNPTGWLFCGMGLVYAPQRLAIAYADYALFVRPSLPLGEYAAWLSTWLRWPGLVVLGVFLALLFPTGRLPSRRWRPVAWTAIGGALMLALGDAFRFGPLFTHLIQNPFGVVSSSSTVLPVYQTFEIPGALGGVMLSTACLASTILLIAKLLRARASERQPLKWFSYAAVPALVGSTLLVVDSTIERLTLLFLDKMVWPALWAADTVLQVAWTFGLLERDDTTPSSLLELRLDTTFEILVVCALLAIPVCTGVGAYRHHLYDTDRFIESRGRAMVTRIFAMRWSQVLLAGAVAGFAPFAFVYLVIYAYVLFSPAFGAGEVDREQLQEVAAFVSGWGARAFFLSITILAASQVARRAGDEATRHGVLVGVVGAMASQAFMLIVYPPLTLDELATYLALGIGGGLLGGVGGRNFLASEVYQATRQIGKAGDASAVANAVGEHLGETSTHGVTLWQQVIRNGGGSGATSGSQYAREFVLRGTWTPREESWQLGARLDAEAIPALASLSGRPSAAFRTTELPTTARRIWEREGVRSALLVPLATPGEASAGLLMVTSRKNHRFSRSSVRAYLTVGAQAALALENLRLVQEAREAGRRTGILVERQRLAREIHDTLAQGFTSIVTSLTAAEMADHPDTEHADSARHLDEARRTARESLAEARRLVWALRPESLDRHSLIEALRRLAMEWSEETGVDARTASSGTPHPLLPEAEVTLLRAAQEALTNVRKHARATRVNITLSYMDDRVMLDVLDDGVGFDTGQRITAVGTRYSNSFGLTAMYERVKQLGGTLLVESAPDQGTTITIELPVDSDEPEPQKSGAAEER